MSWHFTVPKEQAALLEYQQFTGYGISMSGTSKPTGHNLVLTFYSLWSQPVL